MSSPACVAVLETACAKPLRRAFGIRTLSFVPRPASPILPDMIQSPYQTRAPTRAAWLSLPGSAGQLRPRTRFRPLRVCRCRILAIHAHTLARIGRSGQRFCLSAPTNKPTKTASHLGIRPNRPKSLSAESDIPSGLTTVSTGEFSSSGLSDKDFHQMASHK